MAPGIYMIYFKFGIMDYYKTTVWFRHEERTMVFYELISNDKVSYLGYIFANNPAIKLQNQIISFMFHTVGRAGKLIGYMKPSFTDEDEENILEAIRKAISL
jgi:hypothetical protein